MDGSRKKAVEARHFQRGFDQCEIGGLVFIMSLPDPIIFELSRGIARPLANWPDPNVPVFGAEVYDVS